MEGQARRRPAAGSSPPPRACAIGRGGARAPPPLCGTSAESSLGWRSRPQRALLSDPASAGRLLWPPRSLDFPGRTHPVSLRERVPVLRPGQQVPAPRRGHTAVRFRRPSCQHNPGPCAACYLSARLWRGLPSGGDDPLIWRVQRDQTEKKIFFLLLFFLRCFFPCHYSQIGERFSGFSSGSKNSRGCFASMALGRKKI